MHVHVLGSKQNLSSKMKRTDKNIWKTTKFHKNSFSMKCMCEECSVAVPVPVDHTIYNNFMFSDSDCGTTLTPNSEYVSVCLL